MKEAVVLEFPLREAEIESAGEASSKIKQVLSQMGIPDEINRRIAISAYEAAVNVIIHAYRGLMKAVIFRDHTELLVSDEGPGIADIGLALQQGYSTATPEAQKMGFGAGTGLANIVRYPDECRIQSTIGIGTDIRLVIWHQ